jgi:hypothetical protein
MEDGMDLNVGKEVAALRRLTVKELRARYAEVFGDQTKTGNKTWLVKRIAWRLQALAEGDLSERARRRAAELANDADLRTTPPKVRSSLTPPAERTETATLRIKSHDRLPPPGTLLTRRYKGETLEVKVLPRGFEFEGEIYKSLSAVAKRITGTHCNGYLFFRLAGKDGAK